MSPDLLSGPRDDLLAIVTHELTSSATAMLGFAELLASTELPQAEQRQMWSGLLTEGHRLTTMLQDLVDIHTLERGHFPMAPRPIDLRPVLEHAAAIQRVDVHHPFLLELPDSLPLVHADPDRIQQVLANLLSNARKYTPNGREIRLAVKADVRDMADGEGVEVSVSDRGMGIPWEVRAHIFRRFFRVSTPEQRAIKGSGLGLAIAHEIVTAHGGRLCVESDGPDQGSRFWFTLPVAA